MMALFFFLLSFSILGIKCERNSENVVLCTFVHIFTLFLNLWTPSDMNINFFILFNQECSRQKKASEKWSYFGKALRLKGWKENGLYFQELFKNWKTKNFGMFSTYYIFLPRITQLINWIKLIFFIYLYSIKRYFK